LEERYVIKDGYILEITTSRDRFVIKIDKSKIVKLKEILIEEKQHDFTYLDEEIPVSWIKKEYIKDDEFVNKYHPDYLI